MSAADEAVKFMAKVDEIIASTSFGPSTAEKLRQLAKMAADYASADTPADPERTAAYVVAMQRGVRVYEVGAGVLKAALALVVSRAAQDGLAREIAPGIWHFGPAEEADDAASAVARPAGSA